MCFTAPMKFTKSFLRPLRRLRTTGKKRGGAFDTHEPSSPKVTCIGQVRVKSKRRVKQCRRRIGEVSFRTTEQDWIRPTRFSNSGSQSHREQRWVHLPVSVCEALRAFRAEICCFFPCKCSCFRREKNAECGAVFTRWLVAVNGGEGGKRREIEVVVGGGEERTEMMAVRSSRRHVFEDFEVEDLVGEEEETAARVSICIPPKNALLLMRCRSDPIKMAALQNVSEKFDNVDVEEEKYGNDCIQLFCKEESVEEKEQEIEENDEEVDECNTSSFGAVSDQETISLSESGDSCERIEIETEEEDDVVQINPEPEKTIEEQDDVVEINPEPERTTTIEEEEPVVPTINQEIKKENKDEEEEPVVPMTTEETTKENKSGGGVLPECLLLMMCEPKLSMEVSKETWVRGTDFIRLLPERPRKAAKAAVNGGGGDHEPVKRRPSIDSKSKPRVPAPPSKKNDHQPARSSCSLPAASMAAVIERNQVNAGKCEPFALTRCKSEPMGTAAAKLMPEPC